MARLNCYECRIRCLLFIERPLDFSSGLMYNLLRKVIGHEFRLPSVILFVERTSIFTLDGWDAISFCYYDCPEKTEPRKLLTTE